MPVAQGSTGTHQGRKGRFSCDFCRTRKLRCDRPLPCTSCRSRGKKCILERPVPLIECSQQTPPTHPRFVSVATPWSPSSPSVTGSGQGNLRKEIEHLKQLTQDLESRISLTNLGQTRDNHNAIRAPTLPSPEFVQRDTADPGKMTDVVARLEQVSMSQSTYQLLGMDDMVFKIERIRDIPQAPAFISQLGRPVPCIWLPLHSEARSLVNYYVTNLSYIQHVVHRPSLPSIIDDLYRQIEQQEPINPGGLILLLSIITSSTFVWSPELNCHDDQFLFLSSAHASAQSSMWIKVTQTVLNATQNNTRPTLYSIQGLIIFSFVITNLEGVSLRYRSLISTGLLLCRELGLHRIDDGSHSTDADGIETEIGRRVWWYLIATDWLMAVKYGGPNAGVYQANYLHMSVNKPRNINDVDLLNGRYDISQPMSQATDMSYFLQRIRLAEISRNIVDRNAAAVFSQNQQEQDNSSYVLALDFELDQMMNGIPTCLHLDNYTSNIDDHGLRDASVQSYMLHSLMHTQRCKLHLNFLSRGPKDSRFAYSRVICLNSARQIVRAEKVLSESQHPFTLLRLRLAGFLHSIFMASIVLLVDACLHEPSSLDEEMTNGDLEQALRIVGDARDTSFAAGKLFETMMQVRARYRLRREVEDQQVEAACLPGQIQKTGNWANALNAQSVESSISGSREDLYEILDGSMSLDGVHWDDLFSGIMSSSLI